jgi:hypothetical protein
MSGATYPQLARLNSSLGPPEQKERPRFIGGAFYWLRGPDLPLRALPCALTQRPLRVLGPNSPLASGPHLPINLKPLKTSSRGFKFIGCGGQI